MTEPSITPPSSTKKRWLATAGGLLFVAAATWAMFAPGQKQEQVAQLVAAAKAEWATLPPLRRARGEPIEGAAMDFHDQAIAIVTRWPSVLRDIDGLEPDGQEVAWKKYRPLVAPLFEALRGAAACANSRLPMVAPHQDNDLLVVRLMSLACRELGARLDEGRGADAVDGALDLATFAGDLVGSPLRSTQRFGVAGLESLWKVWPPERVATLEQQDRERFATGLAELDDWLPAGLPMAYDLAIQADDLRPMLALADHGGRMRAWRYGFSPAFMVYSALDHVFLVSTQLQEANVDQPWSSRRAQLQQAEDVLLASPNIFVQIFAPPLIGEERQLRRARAGLRLLRLELAWRAGQSQPSLPDPCGDGPIHVQIVSKFALFEAADSAVEPRVAKRSS
ncbi:MAG: hypothetical protein IPK26_09235 [Planctomycetes bacterium]|nr:hypothetical protein [Planctomycetota bacterium]